MSKAGNYDIASLFVPIQFLTGDVGAAVGPDGAGNIDVVGGNNITTGTPLTNTISVAVTGTTQYAVQVGNATNSLTSLATGTANQVLQSGGAAANPAWSTATYPATTAQGDVLYSSANNTVAGLTKDATATRYIANTGAGNNPAWDQVELTNGVSGILPVTNGGTGIADPTDHALIVGSGAAAMTELAVGATNTVLLGNTGADCSWGTVPNAALTNSSVTLSDGNNITVTGSPLSLGGTASFNLTGTTDHTLQLGNATGSLTSLGVATNGQIPIGSNAADPVLATITGSGAINVANGAGTITISGGGTEWSIITADQTIAIYKGYVCNKAGLLSLALPATSAVGTTFSVTGMNIDLGWTVTQGAGQQIHFGDLSTTAGVGGSVASTLKRDSIECVCIVADTTWQIISAVGNITVT